MDSVGSSGIECFTDLPLTKGRLRNPGISGTGDRFSSTYSAAQSMRAKISMAALSAPAPKKCNEAISGWCSSGENLMLPFLQILQWFLNYLLVMLLVFFLGCQFSAQAFAMGFDFGSDFPDPLSERLGAFPVAPDPDFP